MYSGIVEFFWKCSTLTCSFFWLVLKLWKVKHCKKFRIMPSVDLLSLFGFRRSKGLWNSDSVHNRKNGHCCKRNAVSICLVIYRKLHLFGFFWELFWPRTMELSSICLSIRYAWVICFFLFLNQFIYRTTAVEWELLWKKCIKNSFKIHFLGCPIRHSMSILEKNFERIFNAPFYSSSHSINLWNECIKLLKCFLYILYLLLKTFKCTFKIRGIKILT